MLLRSFQNSPGSASAARRFARDALGDLVPDTLEDVELMVSELATNCVRHTGTAFDIVIARTRSGVRVEVTDRGGGTPAVHFPHVDDPTGRGLMIVESLSDLWGVESHPGGGKTVWFSVNAGGGASTPLPGVHPCKSDTPDR